MSRSTLLVSVLEGDAGVDAIAGDRIYPLVLPKNEDVTYPAITYQEISLRGTFSHSGDESLDLPRYQIDCWAETVAEARSLARAVRAALAGIVHTSDGETFRGGFLDNEDEGYDDEARKYRVRADYMLWHEAA